MPIGTPSVPYRLPGSQYERWVDIYTRLGVERILFLGGEVNDGVANALVAQMLYLDSEDSSKPIYLYINSPGGSVTAGLAIYDTIQYIKSDVVTICVGLAASMGAFLLAAGTKGKRVALPHSRIMIHQPLGGTAQGLVNHDSAVGQGHPFAFGAGGQEEGSHRGCQTHADGYHIRLDVLDRVVDR